MCNIMVSTESPQCGEEYYFCSEHRYWGWSEQIISHIIDHNDVGELAVFLKYYTETEKKIRRRVRDAVNKASLEKVIEVALQLGVRLD